MKRFSIIIVTYNSDKDIFDCLESIWENCDIPHEDLEIIVVDNNSKNADKMFTEIRDKYSDNIILIKNDKNGGYGQGNNIGIKQASAPIIMIMNPDVRLMEPIFKTILKAFEDDKKLCMYGMQQMFSRVKKSNRSFSFTNMMNGHLWVILTSLCNKMGCFFPKYQYLQGSCFFIRKDVIEHVGLFDERYFLYGEEDDLHYKVVRDFGAHIKYNSKLHFIHLVEDRPLSLDYEMMLLDIAIKRHEDKGYSRTKTLKNYLRRTDLRLIREWYKYKRGKKNGYEVVRQFRYNIKQLMKVN